MTHTAVDIQIAPESVLFWFGVVLQEENWPVRVGRKEQKRTAYDRVAPFKRRREVEREALAIGNISIFIPAKGTEDAKEMPTFPDLPGEPGSCRMALWA